jgi:hypothetical protein
MDDWEKAFSLRQHSVESKRRREVYDIQKARATKVSAMKNCFFIAFF